MKVQPSYLAASASLVDGHTALLGSDHHVVGGQNLLPLVGAWDRHDVGAKTGGLWSACRFNATKVNGLHHY